MVPGHYAMVNDLWCHALLGDGFIADWCHSITTEQGGSTTCISILCEEMIWPVPVIARPVVVAIGIMTAPGVPYQFPYGQMVIMRDKLWDPVPVHCLSLSFGGWQAEELLHENWHLAAAHPTLQLTASLWSVLVPVIHQDLSEVFLQQWKS